MDLSTKDTFKVPNNWFPYSFSTFESARRGKPLYKGHNSFYIVLSVFCSFDCIVCVLPINHFSYFTLVSLPPTPLQTCLCSWWSKLVQRYRQRVICNPNGPATSSIVVAHTCLRWIIVTYGLVWGMHADNYNWNASEVKKAVFLSWDWCGLHFI